MPNQPIDARHYLAEVVTLKRRLAEAQQTIKANYTKGYLDGVRAGAAEVLEANGRALRWMLPEYIKAERDVLRAFVVAQYEGHIAQELNVSDEARQCLVAADAAAADATATLAGDKKPADKSYCGLTTWTECASHDECKGCPYEDESGEYLK